MTFRMLETSCCVVGGGPAGMMLGYLLAREGVRVTVIEKYRDFFRDFRGDTVHSSTLELFHELNILDKFLKVPHQKLTSAGAILGDFTFVAASFRHVPAHCRFIALMPQWDFLDFVSTQAKQFQNFDLRMEHEATGLTIDAGRITGVEVKTPAETLQIRADLVVGCDGRHSVIRRSAQLEVIETGVPIDVLWFRLSRRGDDPDQLLGNINYGRALILINRGDYFQAGLIIRKGAFDELKNAGLDDFRRTISKIAPYLGGRVEEIQDWDQIRLLTVQINRLRTWYRPGLLCIGDAAHAMSPAGGVGINLAIQDAVAAANLLARPLRRRSVDEPTLATLQARREFPTKVTQFLQINAHRAFAHIFQNPGPFKAPPLFRAVVRIPGLQHVMGRVVAIGVRPEHIADAPVPAKLPRLLVAAAAMVAIAGIFLVKKERPRYRSGI